jgi:hypothetical protein
MPDEATMPADVTITVVRSGGFAGLTRTWSLAVAIDDAHDILDLVDACPWRSIHKDMAARDRFSYAITVRAPRRRRSAAVPESSLTGPWKSLVERVQRSEHASPNRTPPRVG